MYCINGRVKFMITKNDTVKTLYVNEFDNFMKKINQWDDFMNERCKCRYCESIITQNNLHALIPIDNHIEYCCSDPSCISSFSEEEMYGDDNG